MTTTSEPFPLADKHQVTFTTPLAVRLVSGGHPLLFSQPLTGRCMRLTQLLDRLLGQVLGAPLLDRRSTCSALAEGLLLTHREHRRRIFGCRGRSNFLTIERNFAQEPGQY